MQKVDGLEEGNKEFAGFSGGRKLIRNGGDFIKKIAPEQIQTVFYISEIRS